MTSSASLFQRSSEFIARPFVQVATQSLSNGSEIELVVTDPVATTEEPQTTASVERRWNVTRSGGVTVLQDRASNSPQLRFYIPSVTLTELLDSNENSIPEFGIKLLKKIFQPDPNLKVRFELLAGAFTLVTQGYLGVIASGGKEIYEYLGQKGLNLKSPKSILDFILTLLKKKNSK